MASDISKRDLEDLQRELRIIAYGQAEQSLRQRGLPITHEAVKEEVKRVRNAYYDRDDERPTKSYVAEAL